MTGGHHLKMKFAISLFSLLKMYVSVDMGSAE